MSEHREHCREGWIHPVPDHAQTRMLLVCTCERRSGEDRRDDSWSDTLARYPEPRQEERRS